MTQLFSRLKYFLFVALFFTACKTQDPPDIEPNATIPTQNMITYQKMELIGFIHFTVNTFTDKEWGYGDESPEIFNPSELDVEQWAKTAKDAGMKQLILTAKHHDGFCLWPSQYTEHSVKNSPYKNGQADVVREFVEACKKYDLKAGLYLSPWDRNHEDYGTPAYLEYYRNQLRELLTNYGTINEIWFDGANGGDGYYGGARETRRIDRDTYYQWPDLFQYVKAFQPDIKIFSDAGPDVHWIGNEHGFAGEIFWSTFDRDSVSIGTSKKAYLNVGDPQGNDWVVGQCDVSIRPGWFYHESQDTLVKSPQQLMDIYYKSVGRNAILLLNLPPDKRGLIHENDIENLKEFNAIITETFSDNLASDATVKASSTRLNHAKFEGQNLVDSDAGTYWAVDDGVLEAELIIQLPSTTSFDRISLQEPIRFGQRISAFQVEVWQDDAWRQVYKGTTIGYKKLVRIDQVRSDKIKVKITGSNNTVALSEIGIYKASDRE